VSLESPGMANLIETADKSSPDLLLLAKQWGTVRRVWKRLPAKVRAEIRRLLDDFKEPDADGSGPHRHPTYRDIAAKRAGDRWRTMNDRARKRAEDALRARMSRLIKRVIAVASRLSAEQ
jgi:hypothetical protein